MDNITIGFISSIIACIGFGTKYVPVKKYDVGNGIDYSFFLSICAFCCSFLVIPFCDELFLNYWGVLGGMLWGIANLFTVPIIKMIGLTMAYILNTVFGILIGYAIGKFGLFGVDKDIVKHDDNNEEEDQNEKKPILNDDETNFNDNETITSCTTTATTTTCLFYENYSKKKKNIIGFLLSLLNGILLGIDFIPMKIWQQNSPNSNPLDFVFSQISGIFLLNTFVFVIYHFINRKRESSNYKESIILPSFFSGLLFGISMICLMLSTEILGFTVGYPISCTGPAIVSSFWSVLYFKEIKGFKNLILLIISLLFLTCGLILLGISY